jgi:hypothetical protein
MSKKPIAMKGQLVIMLTSGGVDTKTFAPEQCEYACPKFELIRAAMGVNPDTMLEHLVVRYNGKPAHMFVDEDGLMHRWPVNPRATDLARRMIVGPVAIWTGDME